MPSHTKRNPTGKLTVITGGMFAGKTEELVRLVRRAMHAKNEAIIFKSALDTRCDTELVRTHDGRVFSAHSIEHSRDILAAVGSTVQVIGIEEVQFFDSGVVDILSGLADGGRHVIAAGLDQDFRGEPFGFMPRLLALADDVLKLHAICMRCGREASRTQRLIEGKPAKWSDPIILVGASESYEARCRACHEVKNRPATSNRLVRSRRKSPESDCDTTIWNDGLFAREPANE